MQPEEKNFLGIIQCQDVLHRVQDALCGPGEQDFRREDFFFNKDKFGETKFTYHVKNVHKDNTSTATVGSAPGPGWPQWTRRALSPPGGRCLNHEDKFGVSTLNVHVKKVHLNVLHFRAFPRSSEMEGTFSLQGQCWQVVCARTPGECQELE